MNDPSIPSIPPTSQPPQNKTHGQPGDAIRERRPWWTYLIPYPGKVPKLSEKQWSVLGLLSLAELFDHYDIGLMGLALSQIQTGLAISEEDVGGVLAFVRIGSMLAFALSVLADRFGRRRLLLVTILGFTLCTFATAFAQDAWQYMVLQLAARVFITAETLLAVVVLTEELSAQDRGWGIGLLGALGSLGHGLAAIAFGFVNELPFGWRSLYLLGIVPLLFLAYFRRNLPETQRFEDHRASLTGEGKSGPDALRPILHLMRMYPGRVAALAAALYPFDFVVSTAYSFMPKTLQEVHGFSPRQVMVLFLVGGALGILGNIFAGAMGDRFGRKPVMALAMIGNAGALYGFYNARGPEVVVFFWISAIFTILAIGVLFKALGTELFPTSHRSTASGMRTVVSTLGSISGLALEGTLYQLTGSHAAAISYMMPMLVLPPLAILLFLPETARQDLESISPER